MTTRERETSSRPTTDTSPQAVAELCERLDAIARNMNDWDHPITAVGDLQNAVQALRALCSDLSAARDTIRKLHDDRSIANQQLSVYREGLEDAEGRLIGIAGHLPALDDDWTSEHSIIADIRTTLARVDAMAAGEGKNNG
jgi:hypothetical protein